MKINKSQLGTREPSRPFTGTCSARLAAAEEGVVATHAFLVLAAIFVFAHPVAWAENGDDGSIFAVPVAAAAVAVGGAPGPDSGVEPFIHPSMAPDVRVKLEVGLEIAAKRVREIEACGDLFTRLGADGLDMLKTSLYLQADSLQGRIRICGRQGAASSWGGKTWPTPRSGPPRPGSVAGSPGSRPKSLP